MLRCRNSVGSDLSVAWVARDRRSTATSTVQAFGGTLPPTMPSADFCAAVRSSCDDLSPVAGTPHRPPEVRPTAFAARPPDLPPRPLMTMDFAIGGSLVRAGRPRYPVFVHQAAALLHASFRPRLATTPLRFANPLPPSGWIEDFHLQAVVRTRHTTRGPRARKTARRARDHRYRRDQPGLPCAVVYDLYRALLGEPAFATVTGTMR